MADNKKPPEPIPFARPQLETKPPPQYPELGGNLLNVRSIIRDPIPEIDWLIEDLVSKDDIFLLSGQGGLGKTYILMAIAIALASGKPLFGIFPVKKKYSVYYVDEEMSEAAVRRRFSRMLKGQHYPSESDYPENLHIMPQGRLRFDETAKLDPLEAFIGEHEIQVMLVDSVRRTINGSENDSAVANTFFNKVRPLRDAFAMACGFIGHQNKDTKDNAELDVNSRFRGSTDWINLCDTHLAIRAGAGEHRLIVEHGKSRHELPTETFGIRFAHDDPEDRNTPFWLEEDRLDMSFFDDEKVLKLFTLRPYVLFEDITALGFKTKKARAILTRLLKKKVKVGKTLERNKKAYVLA